MRLFDDTDADDDPLPVPDDHPYLHIRPTDDELDPESVATTFERLHQLEPSIEESWLDRLLGSPRPTIEWLLTTTHETADPTVAYYATIDPPEDLDALERHLRTLFPDSYEIDRVDVHPAVELLQSDTDATPAGVTFHGESERRQDYLTRLTPFETFYDDVDDTHQVPLSALVETLANAPVPCVYQALVQPIGNLTPRLTERERAIERGRDSVGDTLLAELLGEPEEYTPDASDRRRLDELAAKNGRRAFAVNARLLLYPPATDDTAVETFASDLTTAFGHVGQTSYDVGGTHHADATDLRDDVRDRTVTLPDYDDLRNYLPFSRTRSTAIVADPAELGSFCLLDGAALTGAGTRALAPTPSERTALPTPPPEQLQTYQGRGLPLGVPLSADDTSTDDPLVLPPELQPLHVGWFGKTGSGKSTGLVNAILDNHAATRGADILIDPKGDGMAVEYLRAHYARYGSLDNVRYFDCADTLPAIPVFDVREELDAGVPRATAVEDAIDHYLEMLAAIMGEERFQQAVRSPDVIRYLLQALFDPVHGADAFPHGDLLDAQRGLQDRQSAPPVSDDDLEALLAGVVATDTKSFEKVMQGVANRIEKIPADRRLARIFNHVPDQDDDTTFDLADVLDENAVVILDTGELRTEAQRVLALVVLSNLWTALRRRARRAGGEEYESDATADLPLVNLYVEEAASVAVSDLLQELLAQSRSFGCSITLATQFPGQLRAQDEAVYRELLNNVSTYVTGNVAVDPQLTQRLATDDMPPRKSAIACAPSAVASGWSPFPPTSTTPNPARSSSSRSRCRPATPRGHSRFEALKFRTSSRRWPPCRRGPTTRPASPSRHRVRSPRRTMQTSQPTSRARAATSRAHCR
ncbi:hypothetical protein VB773_00105 [Haloarculaceae archaeon H-GB2-1]|nr:hypothetical protein [Haloarculaceae archaeon H-GB2-1]